eukprot:5488164-Pleurochrysis_carterae.AAC.1
MQVVMTAAEVNMRRAAKSTAGGRRLCDSSAVSSSSRCVQALAVKVAEMNARLDVLKEATAQMLLAVAFYDASLASRLVHVRLE